MFATYKSKGKDDLELLLKEIMENNVRDGLMPFKEFEAIVTNATQSIDAILYHVIKEKIIQETGLPRDELSYLAGYRGMLGDPMFKDKIHLAPVNFMFDQFTKLNADKNNVVYGNLLNKEKKRKLGKKLMVRHIERACTLEYLQALRDHFPVEVINQLLEDDWYTTKGAWNVSGEAKQDNIEISGFLDLDQYTERERAESILLNPRLDTEQYKKASEGLRFVYTLNTITHLDSGWRDKLGDYMHPIRTKQESRTLLASLDASASFKDEIIDLAVKREDESRRRIQDAEAHANEEKRLRVVAEDARDIAIVAQGEAEAAKERLIASEQKSAHNTGNFLGTVSALAEDLYKRLSEGVIDTGTQELSRTVYALNQLLQRQNQAKLALYQESGELLRTNEKIVSLEGLVGPFLQTMNNAEQYIRQKRDENRTMKGEVYKDCEEDYVKVHEDVFIGSVIGNIHQNSIRALAGIENAEISCIIETKEDKMRLYVIDNGYGMDDETRLAILENREIKTTGTGLRIGYQSIKSYLDVINGKLEIWSKREDGFTGTEEHPFFEKLGYSTGTIVGIELPKAEKQDDDDDDVKVYVIKRRKRSDRRDKRK
ncbi:HAMP domain-containing histidine kinase [Candidatus Woesearchaeota archaeon]|jgi:signal transduction histidine kinase|nr:HAMP domain-containing histidine kinase [Candidatus Woesearchaeota archaeon]